MYLSKVAKLWLLDDVKAGALQESLLLLLGPTLRPKQRFHFMEVELDALDEKLGQSQFEAPSVFNFFLPDYQPAGAVASAGLRAPEAQLGTAPHVVRWLNGASSLIRNGLTSCDNGFGPDPTRRGGASSTS